jgi:hypothetical protein
MNYPVDSWTMFGPPELPVPKPAETAAEPVPSRHAGGFGRLRTPDPKDDVEPPVRNEKYCQPESAPKAARVWSDLKPDDIPF